MTIHDLLIATAKGEIGTREEGGNNVGKRIVEYQQATWLKPGAWPWCAAFMAWCMREWLKMHAVTDALGLTDTDTFAWRCRDASAFGWEKWAAKHPNTKLIPHNQPAKAGDFVIFEFSHIGLVSADQLPGKEFIETIEGNTSPKGLRDSTAGDGVYAMTRHTSIVRSYIRILPV